MLINKRIDSVNATDYDSCNSLHVMLCRSAFCFQEKHAKQPTQKLDQFFTDKKSHLYTLGMFHGG